MTNIKTYKACKPQLFGTLDNFSECKGVLRPNSWRPFAGKPPLLTVYTCALPSFSPQVPQIHYRKKNPISSLGGWGGMGRVGACGGGSEG